MSARGWIGLTAAAAIACASACSDQGTDGTDGTSSDDGIDSIDLDSEILGEEGTDALDALDVGPDTELPQRPWHESAVFYEVFVRSFQDSNGDGVGDFQGLISRLDYINDGVPGSGDDLEADAIWLMPIHPSPSYHGYDVTNYDALNPDFGTMEDFVEFLDACQARGIRVILDWVVNHSSSQHQWFINSASGPSALRRSWYLWRNDNPGWKRPFQPGGNVWHLHPSGDYYYGVFWSGMPDLNYREPQVADAITQAAIPWLQRGVSGFRIDAARYLVEGADGQLADQAETHDFFKAFRAQLETERPEDFYMVGEAWTTRSKVAPYYGGGDEFHQAFDFDLQLAIERALKLRSAAQLASEIAFVSSSGAPWAFSATFVGNHDIDRLSFRLNETQQRTAAALLLTLPGTPYLYYGDELGMKMGLVAGDPAKRTPMAWDSTPAAGFSTTAPWIALSPQHAIHNVQTQLADPNSLLRYWQSLIRLRKANPALQSQHIVALSQPNPSVFAMLRGQGPGATLVVCNLGDQPLDAPTIELQAAAPALVASSGEADRLWPPPNEPVNSLQWSTSEGISLEGALASGECRVYGMRSATQ